MVSHTNIPQQYEGKTFTILYFLQNIPAQFSTNTYAISLLIFFSVLKNIIACWQYVASHSSEAGNGVNLDTYVCVQVALLGGFHSFLLLILIFDSQTFPLFPFPSFHLCLHPSLASWSSINSHLGKWYYQHQNIFLDIN